MSDNQKNSIDGLYEQLADTKLKIALTLLAEEEARGQQREIERDEALGREAAASRDRIWPRLMRRLEGELGRQRKRHFARHTLPRVANVAAAVIFVCFVGLTTALALSATVRVQMMELIQEDKHIYTQLSLEEVGAFDMPADWLGRYYPAYVPEGYEIKILSSMEDGSDLLLQNADDERIYFLEEAGVGVTNIDTEDAQMHEISFHGGAATLVRKGTISTLMWYENNRYYVLWVDGDEEFLMKIAAGLRSVN